MLKIEGSPIHLVIADHDINWMMETAQSFASHPQIKVIGFAQNGSTVIDRATSMVADAVLMEFSMPDMSAIDVTKRLAEDSPGTAIFAVTSTLSTQLIQQARANGVVEVFMKKGFVAREAGNRICDYVDNLRHQWNTVSKEYGTLDKGTGPIGQKIKTEYITKPINQTVVLTYNVKGGVGKSTIAANLATAIKMSPYLGSLRVCLVDFDCGGANVITNCHLPDMAAINRNISTWAHVGEDLSAKEADELLIEGPEGLMIAAAPLNQAIAENITTELADKILRILKRYYTVIVIDGAPNLSAPIDSAFNHATHILAIVNPEGQSIKQLARTVQLLSPDPNYPEKPDMTHVLRKMFLVLNYIQPPSSWDLKKTEIAETVRLPLFTEIPYDEVIKKALHSTQKEVAVSLDPNAPFSIAIKRLANDICNAYPEGIEEKSGNHKSLFSRLFRKKT